MSAVFCLAMLLLEHARTHKQQMHAHYAQLTAMVAAGKSASEDAGQLNQWEAQLYDIELSGNEVRPTLMILCENQIRIACGQPDKTVPINGWRRLAAYLYDPMRGDPSRDIDGGQRGNAVQGRHGRSCQNKRHYREQPDASQSQRPLGHDADDERTTDVPPSGRGHRA